MESMNPDAEKPTTEPAPGATPPEEAPGVEAIPQILEQTTPDTRPKRRVFTPEEVRRREQILHNAHQKAARYSQATEHIRRIAQANAQSAIGMTATNQAMRQRNAADDQDKNH